MEMRKESAMRQMIAAYVGVLGGAAAALLGGWDGVLAALLGLMAVDYITGLLVAGVFHRSGKTQSGTLSSDAGFRGLCKKGVMLLLVLVGARMDELLGLHVIRSGVAMAFVANELISILENAALMGVPVPEMLRRALDLVQTENGEEKA
jgi:toxin secretion/phage lysis holin